MNTPLEVSPALAEELRRLREHVGELERERKELNSCTPQPTALSTDHYQLLYEHTPAMSFALTPEGTILSVNRFGADQLGYSPEDLTGRSVLLVFDPTDHQTVREQLTLCSQNPYKIFQWEIQKVRQSGGRLWVRETARSIRNAQGNLIVLVMCEDITKHKEAEEALQESEVRFRQIAETIEEVVWSADPAIGKMQYISPAYERVWGRTCASLYEHPKSFMDAIHPDDRERILTDLAVQRDGLPFAHEYRVVRPDGVIRWVWDRGFPVRDRETGHVTHYVGVALDITDRKQDEEAIRVGEERLQSIFQTSPECVKLVAADGTLLEINPAGLAMAGARTAEDVIGQSIYTLISPAYRDAFRIMHERVCRGNKEVLEYESIGLDGIHRWMESYAAPLLNPADGRIVHLAITRDITERKRTEEALRQSEQAVRESFDERERLSQDLHDNLLQSLYAVGMGLDLTKQRIKQTSPVNAKRLESSVAQLNAVIREVRSFIPRMYTPTMKTNNVAESLRSLVGSFVSTGAGDITMALDDHAALQLSPEQSTHVLAIAKEALSNSLRHTKAANRSITLALYRGNVRLEVADDGDGFQLRERGKLGMGIRNMRSRAARLNARFSIRTSQGNGTRLSLTLPPRT
jgi:PAS domain S-box-containing protein